jgi:hypothetical protein
MSISKKVSMHKNSIKVSLTIRNNHRYEITNVILTDHLLSPLKLVKDFGTIEPTAIKTAGKKVSMTWRLGTFGPLEERVVSYDIKSALKVMGTIMLPAAKVRSKIKKVSKTFESNRVAIRGKEGISKEIYKKPPAPK